MKNFKAPFLSALVFFGTLLALSVGYAAWTSLVLSDADGGKPLTSTLLKSMINSINDVGTRTDGISSVGGNIGIGTASPILGAGEGLHVKSNTQPNAKIILEQGGISGGMNFSNNSNGLYFNSAREIGFWPQNINTMTLTGGNVGIGTASPTAKLDVRGRIQILPDDVNMAVTLGNIRTINGPSCTATERGQMKISIVDNLNEDGVCYCLKVATNYVWRCLDMN